MSRSVPASVVGTGKIWLNNEAWPLCGQPRLPLSVSVKQYVPLARCDWLTVTGQLPL